MRYYKHLYLTEGLEKKKEKIIRKLVVGITKGYDEAVELVEQIVQEVYDQTGTCDIRSYILEKEQGR